MKQEEFFEWRGKANDRMFAADPFFKQFNMLDTVTYEGGLIPLKYKELTGLSLAIAARCDQCIRHHLQKCIEAGANSGEMSEAVAIAVITAGSWSFPQARLAFELMVELGVITESDVTTALTP